MKLNHYFIKLLTVAGILLALMVMMSVQAFPVVADGFLVDDFEAELLSGTDGSGNLIGFYTFDDSNSTVAIARTDAPPEPVPDATAGNHVLQVDTHVVPNGWAGLVHAFENETVDTWVPQDWSGFEGFSFWLFGNNTGSILFVDILDNRKPGSTSDDAERYSIDIIDDFSGWQYFEIPFEDFHRKDVGNGAPNDGFTLTEVHGWAFGVFSSNLTLTNYIDDVGTYGTRPLQVSFSSTNYEVDEGDSTEIVVKLSRNLGFLPEDPDVVTVDYALEPGSATQDRDFIPVPAGTLTFVQGGALEQTILFSTLDDTKYEGDERVIFRLSNIVGTDAGFNLQAAGVILDNDPYEPLLLDDFERYPYLWDSSDKVILTNPEIEYTDPNALPGQGAYEGVLGAITPLHVEIEVQGRICNQGNGVISVILLTTDNFDATTVDHTTVTLGDAYETHIDKKTGLPQRHEDDVDGDGDIDLVFHFRFRETGLPCDPEIIPFNGWTFDGQPITAGGAEASFGRDFALGQDWSDSLGLAFWYYGSGGGDEITVSLKDNRAYFPGQGQLDLVWSDEFNDPAGTPPNPAYWTHEVGDGTVNGIPGWGNSELQYYTTSTDNAATDGEGNLVIKAAEADGSLMCYYGACEYSSARLISNYKAEFAYGKIEARIKVPAGEGLWPAFWALGTDIGEVGWPQSGEIDIMEFVGREPYEVFGTLHGPGYSGGESFGDTYTFDVPVPDDYHTYSIEWRPDSIRWYVDDIKFHDADPKDVEPNEWVFNHPFFIIMNLAVGGNFGGPVGEDTVFPAEMVVDYVRVYQGPDTAERWESTFIDDFYGWQQVEILFDNFVRSDDQPEKAPDDGLGLTEVWGYGFQLPDEGTTSGMQMLDQVWRVSPEAPMLVTVENLNDSGAGSLRQALETVAVGGTIQFDPTLADGTITLTSGPLVISKDVTLDGLDDPGLVISGNDAYRVFEIGTGVSVGINNLTIANGHAIAGAGIYVGGEGSLTLIDSTLTDNHADGDGGGIFAALEATVHIERATISYNSGNVGGAICSKGDATILNSTLSGNQAIGWWGSAIFHSDGVMNVINSTITQNIALDWAPAAILVGSWGPEQVSIIYLTNSIVSDNQWTGCILYSENGGTPELYADHNNVFSDATCNPGTTDLVTDPLLGPLADNGGDTLTHALLVGSPAIDAADGSVCPLTDQRGIPRDAACDVGSYEFVP